MPAKPPKIDLETHGPQIVEAAHGSTEDQTTFAEALEDVGTGSMLGYRLEQQAALSNFGVNALKSRSIDEILDHACKTAAAGMRASLAKTLQYRPIEKDLLIRAGTGWRPGVVGHASLGADAESPAGYAFQTGSPVISNHLENEENFRTPPIMAEHGVRRAINVLIACGGSHWGVLEVDSPNPGIFEVADLAFLQGLANFIGVALERQKAEDGLTEALEFQKILVKEASHRVKNSLAILAGMLRLKSRSSADESAAGAFADASDRIIAVARTHDRLWQDSQSQTIDLGHLLHDLCHALHEQWAHINFTCTAQSAAVPADRAASFALLVMELATNAAKHAYGPEGGDVHVNLVENGREKILEIRDDGVGLPADFSLARTAKSSLGMRLMQTLTQSIGGRLELGEGPGAVFRVRF